MENIPHEEQNSPEETKNKLATITEDSEYFIIDTGTKKRYVHKWKYVSVNGEKVKTEKLVKALALYPDDGPAEALKKISKRASRDRIRWRRARAVEWAALEMQYIRKSIGGSNPPASASDFSQYYQQLFKSRTKGFELN